MGKRIFPLSATVFYLLFLQAGISITTRKSRLLQGQDRSISRELFTPAARRMYSAG